MVDVLFMGLFIHAVQTGVNNDKYVMRAFINIVTEAAADRATYIRASEAVEEFERRGSPEEVGVILRASEQGIQLIQITSTARRQGKAGETLRAICAIADEYQLPIFLIVAPNNGEPMSYDDLTAWYTRHGFEMLRNDVMKRTPR